MKTLLLCFSILLSTLIFAQDDCGVRIIDSLEFQQLESTIQMTSNKNRSIPACNTIRVVVHVVYDSANDSPYYNGQISEEQVRSQIRATNQFFRNDSAMYDESNTPLGYNIKLAEYDPEGNPTTGIIYHDGVELFGEAWSTYGLRNTNTNAIAATTLSNAVGWGEDLNGKKYLNSYVVSSIDGSVGGGVQAFAYFPTGNQVYGNYNLFNTFGRKLLEDEYDQIFSLKAYTNRGLTYTHELLHNFALYHTFQGNSCLPESDPEWQGDRVADTPPQTQGSGCTGACDFISNNVMDYISQGCKLGITPGQVDRASLVIDLNLQDYMVCSTCPDKSIDFNNDGITNILDISLFISKYGCNSSQPCFDSNFDLNCDGLINIIDVSLLLNLQAAS